MGAGAGAEHDAFGGMRICRLNVESGEHFRTFAQPRLLLLDFDLVNPRRGSFGSGGDGFLFLGSGFLVVGLLHFLEVAPAFVLICFRGIGVFVSLQQEAERIAGLGMLTSGQRAHRLRFPVPIPISNEKRLRHLASVGLVQFQRSASSDSAD